MDWGWFRKAIGNGSAVALVTVAKQLEIEYQVRFEYKGLFLSGKVKKRKQDEDIEYLEARKMLEENRNADFHIFIRQS